MAKVTEFFPSSIDSSKPHPTSVECGYQIVRSLNEILLQLSTYGSDDRRSQKKVSQTIQLDRERAAELVKIIKDTFPGI
mgnify:CR=1 FL=1